MNKEKKNTTFSFSHFSILVSIYNSFYFPTHYSLHPYHQKSAPSFVSYFPLSDQEAETNVQILRAEFLSIKMELDWDLHAVVRGYSAVSSASSAAVTATIPSSDFYSVSSNSTNNSITPFSFGRNPTNQTNHLFSLQDPLFEGPNCNSSEELHELFKPFVPKSQRSPPPPPPHAPPILSSPVAKILTHQKQQQNTQIPKQLHLTSVSAPRSKRR